MKAKREYQHEIELEKNGFTLIEVLFAITIISILSMISMPLYQNYQVRTKVSGELSLMRPLMTSMIEKYALYSEWPSSNADAGAREPEFYKGKYLLSATISDSPQAGTMTLVYDVDKLPALRGTNTLVFYPGEGNNSANWKCDQGSLPSKYRPSNCQ